MPLSISTRPLTPTGRCHYVENSLFNGVLGLLIWEVVFAALPGAFYNPFQYRPSDFYAHDFCIRRSRLLAAIWADIDSNEDIWRIIEPRWRQKQGLMNPLVNWQLLDLDLLRLALESHRTRTLAGDIRAHPAGLAQQSQRLPGPGVLSGRRVAIA